MNGMKRIIGRWVAVGAVALLLGGAVATPAGAMRRSEAVKQVNQMISLCFATGGDPYVEESEVNWGFSFLCEHEGYSDWGWYDYDVNDSGNGIPDPKPDLRRAVGGEQTIAADDPSHGAADAADHGRQKAHKHDKHKAHAGQHRQRHRK